jgi:Fur family ferric uptake transcriptional regulator
MSTDDIKLRLRELNLKETPIRLKILSILSESGCPKTALDLIYKVRANKTTIYRETKKLVSSGFISEVILGDGQRRFEISTSTHHHYLFCSKCKKIIPIKMKHSFSKTEKFITNQYHFHVQKHDLEFFGLCQKCI